MFYSCSVLSPNDGSNGISDYLDSGMDCRSLHRQFEEAAVVYGSSNPGLCL